MGIMMPVSKLGLYFNFKKKSVTPFSFRSEKTI